MRHGKPWIKSAGALVAAIAAVKLLLHLYAGRTTATSSTSSTIWLAPAIWLGVTWISRR